MRARAGSSYRHHRIDSPIKNKSLSNTCYQIENEEILKVYANSVPEVSDKGKNGRYVIIELKAETDLNARPRKAKVETEEERKERDRKQGGPGLKAGWSTGGNDIYPENAVITQVQAIQTTHGKTYPASDVPFESITT